MNVVELHGAGGSGAERTEADLRKLRDTVGKVVGSVFYGELFRAMREDPLRGTYGHGGRGEEVFGAQFDALLAERMGERDGYGVADAIFSRLEQQQRLISEARASRQGETT